MLRLRGNHLNLTPASENGRRKDADRQPFAFGQGGRLSPTLISGLLA